MPKRATPIQQKRRHLKHRYGITADDYDRMFEEQNHQCAICDKPSGDTKGTRLYVDHDHETNKVRALLCAGCNTMIGGLENINNLKGLQYLMQHNSNSLARLELLIRERNDK